MCMRKGEIKFECNSKVPEYHIVQDKLRAMPLEAAVRIMTEAWGDYFSSDTYRALHHTDSAKQFATAGIQSATSAPLSDGFGASA